MNRPATRKRRTRGHVIADLSVNFVERQVLLCGHTVERVCAYYGYDLFMLSYTAGGEVEKAGVVMIVDKIVNTTYGALEQALFQLGFVASYGKNGLGSPYVMYDQRDCDAQIYFPVRPKDELMYGGHFIVAERTVEGRGVADAETFHKLLREAAQKGTQAA